MSQTIAVVLPLPVALALGLLVLVLLMLSAVALSFRGPAPVRMPVRKDDGHGAVRGMDEPGREETWPH